MKEVEKYVGYYLLIYLIVLAVCGFFQYLTVCQGRSLACAVNMQGMNTIITTTAYVLTPIVAIIGFQSWKNQFNHQQISILAEKCLDYSNKNLNDHISLSKFLNKYNDDFESLGTLSELQIRIRILEKDILSTYTLINRLSNLTKDSILESANSYWLQQSQKFTSKIILEKSQEDLNKIYIELNQNNHLNFIDVGVISYLGKLTKAHEKLENCLSKYILVK